MKSELEVLQQIALLRDFGQPEDLDPSVRLDAEAGVRVLEWVAEVAQGQSVSERIAALAKARDVNNTSDTPSFPPPSTEEPPL